MTYDASIPRGDYSGVDRAAETLKATPKDRRLTPGQRGRLFAATLYGSAEQHEQATERLRADDQRRKGKGSK